MNSVTYDKLSKHARLMRVVLMLGVFLLPTSYSHADIINPNVLELTQPDGTQIELRFKGTGRLNWYEDLSGFPVVQVGDTYYYQQDVDPTKRSRLLEVGKVNPKEAGVKRISQVERDIFFRQENAGENPFGPLPVPQGAPQSVQPVPPIGTVKNLVVLVRFSDHTSRPLPSQADMDTLFNAVGGDPVLAPTGSIRDIYQENSYNQLTIDSTVLPWFTVSNTEAYYADGVSALGGGTNGVVELWDALEEALDNADITIDFSNFDTDSDGFIDAITFVHSGYAAEFGGTDAYGAGSADRIWSHKWTMSTWTSNESVSVANYNINPGVWGTSGSSIGRVGVIAHELGHFFGLPDYYDYNTGAGIGSWGLMANSWGFSGDQYNPPHMSAHSKIELGWASATTISSAGTYTAAQVETNPEIYRIDQGYPSGEYLLIENRQPVGIESTMPQGGLAIWHIDENKPGNNDTSFPPNADWPTRHYKIALMQADGFYNLEKNNNRGDGGDVYHAGGVDNVNSSTDPSTDSYQSGTFVPTGLSIYDIDTSGANMDFTIGFPPPDPTFVYPAGGEIFTGGTQELITWLTNGASASTDYELYVGRSCAVSDEFIDDVEGSAQFVASHDTTLDTTYDWAVSTANPYEGSSHWHADAPGVTADQYLTTTSSITVPTTSAELSFWHSYDIELNWDGGVVEISVDGGSTWQDLGSSATLNGYSIAAVNSGNPLTGRPAFSGVSGGYINTVIDMSAYAGATVDIRFRVGTDSIIGRPGWDVDLVTVTGASPTMYLVGNTTGTTYNWTVNQPTGTDYCFSLQGTNTDGQSNVVYSNLFDIVGGTGATCNGLLVNVDLNLGQSTTPGNDVVLGTPGNDDIRGKAGNDTICGMGGDDFIHGNSGDDWIDGGDGVDTLKGGQGNDIIFTGLGSTVGIGANAFGGYGDDTITGAADEDDLRGGKGIDTIYGKGGNDSLIGNDDDDFLIGGTGADYLKGGQGMDDLKGGADDDLLDGGADDDILNGGAGTYDICDGGAGTGDTATASCETVIDVP